MLRTALRPIIPAIFVLLAIVALITAVLNGLGQYARRRARESQS